MCNNFFGSLLSETLQLILMVMLAIIGIVTEDVRLCLLVIELLSMVIKGVKLTANVNILLLS